MILTQDFVNDYKPQESITKSVVVDSNQRVFNRDSALTYDIFLSHSYSDKVKVHKLVKMFNDCGYSVYVDWIDDKQLDRSLVDSQTANILKARMKNSKGLAFLTTANSVSSKWCPWELGYMDGLKNGRCCILPVLQYKRDYFSGQEYLGIYPYLDYEVIGGTTKYEFWVNSPSNPKMYVNLRDWLNGKALTLHRQNN